MNAHALAKRSRMSVAVYSPKTGLQSIAVAEVAEKHYARAKDAVGLERAIRAKLTAQAEFVFWWDTQAAKDTGGRPPGKTRTRSGTGLRAGENGLPDRNTIQRWRKKLNDPRDFEATYEEALLKYRQWLEFDSTVHVSHNTGEFEWYTPEALVEAAREVLGAIDLDPASSAAANAVVRAKKFFTTADDGLKQPWKGRVWMNPPYTTQLITQFAEKLVIHVRAGDVPAAIVIVNNGTETEWFAILASVATAVCFPRGRVKFWSPRNEGSTPLQGQAVLYIGPDVDGFCRRFAGFGTVWPDYQGAVNGGPPTRPVEPEQLLRRSSALRVRARRMAGCA